MRIDLYPNCRQCKQLQTGHKSGLCELCRTKECPTCRRRFIAKMDEKLCPDCRGYRREKSARYAFHHIY